MRVEAPAKINLTLEVTGVEANGYHTLDTLFAWLELHDTLELEQASQTTLLVSGDAPGTELVSADEDNLVFKALRALESRVKRPLPTEFRLLKRIPTGGGLGGGSADASAALWGLNRLHHLGLEQDELLAIGRKLGADVAFGLVGGFARGTGYGDQLEPLPFPDSLEDRTLVLVHPDFPCFTPKVYAAWDQLRCDVAKDSSAKFLATANGLPWVANDLEPAAFSMFPELAGFKEAMIEAGLEACCLSGSGSTLFGFLPTEGSLAQVEKGLSSMAKITTTRLRKERRGG